MQSLIQFEAVCSDGVEGEVEVGGGEWEEVVDYIVTEFYEFIGYW